MKHPVDINRGLEFDGKSFKTFNARARYIRTVIARRPQWLSDHPGEWSSGGSTAQTATPIPADSGVIKREPITSPSSSTSQNVGEDFGAPRSTEKSVEELPSVDSSPMTDEIVSDPYLIAKTELEIADRTYVSAACFAKKLGISERTLSRWCADGKGPPHIKIQGLYFERDKIREWAASRGINFEPV
jgi:hypothetical protein